MAVKPEATYGLEETISRGQRDSSSQTARGAVRAVDGNLELRSSGVPSPVSYLCSQ